VFSHLTSTAAALARRHGIPYVVRPAGCLDVQCLRMGHRRLKIVFAAWFTRKDLSQAAGIHATSQSEAEGLKEFATPRRIWVVPHGVDVPVLNDRELEPALFARFPCLKGRRIVLCMGRVHPIKRFPIVVEALASLGDAGRNLALVIAGNDAGDLASVESTARRHALQDRVVFAGFVQEDLKRSILSAADLLVHPSLHENFGVAIVEAMAHGVPALVSPGVATHVYVDQSGCGLTVEGTVQSLTEGMRKIINGDGAAMGRRGREFVQQHLSWQAVMRQYDRMYQDALGVETR